MAKHNEFGAWGEQLAVEALVRKGCAIVERNWKSGHYEIDIIAMRGNRLIFVEVKTRVKDEEEALAAVNRRKIHRICNAAHHYILMSGLNHEVQFDIITIVGSETDYKLHHIEDAFFPPLKSY